MCGRHLCSDKGCWCCCPFWQARQWDRRRWNRQMCLFPLSRFRPRHGQTYHPFRGFLRRRCWVSVPNVPPRIVQGSAAWGHRDADCRLSLWCRRRSHTWNHICRQGHSRLVPVSGCSHCPLSVPACLWHHIWSDGCRCLWGYRYSRQDIWLSWLGWHLLRWICRLRLNRKSSREIRSAGLGQWWWGMGPMARRH